jgi:hypothetical protein
MIEEYIYFSHVEVGQSWNIYKMTIYDNGQLDIIPGFEFMCS